MNNLKTEQNESQDNLKTFLYSSTENSQNVDRVRDVHPAIQQLFALGYEKGDTVTGRNILPQRKGKKAKNQDWQGTLGDKNIAITELKYHAKGDYRATGAYHEDGLAWLHEENGDKQIYYNVNGGRNNAAVERIYSIFFEHDTGTHSEQMAQVLDFPIPASIAVKTRKSTHCYFTVAGDDIGDLSGWKQGQAEIAYTMGSDPAVKDLPRLMRLAGFDHIKEGFSNVRCTLEICDPDNAYTYEEILSANRDYAVKIGIKPFTQLRFKAYQYVNNRLNQKKDGRDYRHERFDPDFFRKCEDNEIAEQIVRGKDWARLCEKKRKGDDVDPESAWTNPLPEVAKRVKKEYDIDLIPSLSQGGELLTVKWVRAYAEDFEENGRSDWHTCKCPDHAGHSSDSLHINVITGALKCHSGCDSHDVEVRLRQLAKDAGDETWNWELYKGQAIASFKRELTPEEDALQLELDRKLYHEYAKIDFAKCERNGIKVTIIHKSDKELSPADLNIEKGKITIGVSGMGTGKTINAGRGLEEYSALYSPFSRRVLARSACNPLQLTYIDEINRDTYRPFRRAFCANRSDQMAIEPLLMDGALIVDEAPEVFNYYFEDLCNKDNKRPQLLKALETFVKASLQNGTALFMSADIAQKEIDYIKAIAPVGTPIELIFNTYQMPKGNVHFSTDASPEGLMAKMHELLEAREPCYVIDDFKNGYKGVKTVAEFALQQLKTKVPDSEVVTIHGDNSGSHEVVDYIEDVNERSLNTSLLAVSPSVTSGISLTNGRFKNVFLFINGILTDKEVAQAANRVRGAENIYIWVAEKGVNITDGGGVTPGDINAYYQRNYDNRNKYLLSYDVDFDLLTKEWSSPHWELRCKNIAYRNLVMRRLRYWVQVHFEGLGYSVIPTEFGENKDIAALHKELWKFLTIDEALAVDTATILDKSEEDLLLAKRRRGESLSPKELADMRKTHIFKVFGEELTLKTEVEAKLKDSFVPLEGFAAVAYKNAGSRWEKKLKENYYMKFGGSVEAAKRDIKKEKAQQQFGERFIGDIRWTTRGFKLWEHFDIKQFLQPEVRFTPLDFYPVFMKMQEFAPQVKDAIGLEISKMTCGQLFGEIRMRFGYEVGKQRVGEKGNQGWESWITQESWDYAEEFCQFQESKKEERAKEEANKANKVTDISVAPPPVLYSERSFTGGGVLPEQMLTPSELQPKTDKKPLESKEQIFDSKISLTEALMLSIANREAKLANLARETSKDSNEKLDPTTVMMDRVSARTPLIPVGARARFLAVVAKLKARVNQQYDPDYICSF